MLMTNPLQYLFLPHIFPHAIISTVGGSETFGNNISCSNSETFRISSTDVLVHESIQIKIHKYVTLREVTEIYLVMVEILGNTNHSILFQ